MSDGRRTFYSRTGSRRDDLITLLHLPYTAWHLSYVVIGASLAPTVDKWRLAGTFAAFFSGMGVGAHALDELHDRPLATSLSDRSLWLIGTIGLALAGGIAVVGVWVISPWVLAFATVGVVMAVAYPLELLPGLHSDLGFALSWGAFPVLVGYWAQSERLTVPALILATAATLLSLLQRSLSRSAKRIRRSPRDGDPSPDRFEDPLRLLAVAVVTVAVALAVVNW